MKHGRKRSLLNRARTNAQLLFQEQKLDRRIGSDSPAGYRLGMTEEIIEDASHDLKLAEALRLVRDATVDTPYEGNIWIVGGYVRDKQLGRHQDGDDVDLVMQSNALELANLLEERGISEIAPVVYPRFGTAMVRVAGCDVELVTARKESYADDSRKPSAVAPATLDEDALRRDFTVNTLLENLHTGELRDPLGQAFPDLKTQILRTPLPPDATFADDPLRMLRAVRFASKLDFSIAPDAWDAISANATRMRPPKVSLERVRDEFCKILMVDVPSQGIEMLRRSGLLEQFAPELCESVGVTQNEFHSLPVWDHTLLALDNLVARSPSSPLLLRLATLLHDIGKPRTKSAGEDGRIHFYHHQDVGAQMARELMTRLKFSLSDTNAISSLVAQHMRIGEYKDERWSDAAVRRMVRDTGDQLPGLFELHKADVSALSDEHHDLSRSIALRSRIDALEQEQPSSAIESPLSGTEIMETLGLSAGPEVGRWKNFLLCEVLEGRLTAGDADSAKKLLREQRNSLL